ncbi:MAG: glutamate--tRNA ligase [Rikenellaceae bacterium]|nr:glutamate--tRNA ligase [Rikenellaceae bacterium]MCL2691854.1 glutamate--tRNA ligase [Rikenellaceae bacterium]
MKENQTDTRVRVRFAPSPTGPLHIGGVRTALYNYLFARRHGGTFILRIEDTDAARFVPGAEEYINEALAWCGIEVDEGVREGGPHGPYRQSERREIYLQYALQLVAAGAAYYAFDTPEALEALRAETEARGGTFAYNHAVRGLLETSLRLSDDEVRARIERGDQWVIRFRMPEGEDVVMHDIVRGEVVVNTSALDDKVLFKSADGLPTYHLANIVDDHLMEITHVIRGEEWLPSLPLHYLLYRAFGWSATQPVFAHLPLLLKPSGQGKLSKRDGDKLGFPVFPLSWRDPATGEVSRGYREDGYFPEAFVNMLALLGWNPGTEQEIFSMEELIETFSLDRVGKSGARFSPDKALWFNAQYMHTRSDEELGRLFLPILSEHGISVGLDVAARVAGLVKTRATFVSDFWDLASFFFVAPAEYEQKTVEKYWKGDNPERVREVRSTLAALGDFSAASLRETVQGLIAVREWPTGQVMNALRLAVVGASKGPDMFDILELIGKAETLRRLDRALEII